MAARISFTIVLFIFAAVAPIYGVQFAPVVTTTSGQVRGLTLNTIHRYIGIPFAKAERFKPPGSPTPWTSTKDVFYPGKVCPQMPSAFYRFTEADLSEDCLNLNVFVPSNIDMNTAALPVMVWVYGGGFTSGTNRIYDGSLIAALGEVIVVAINYRVGVFGFLATGKEGLKGNYGMLDQVEGLKWVKNNIKRFGGDPGKVTIFGESAGGASVGLLMLSPLTSGLYHNAIPQSGSGPAMWATTDYTHAQKIARAFGKLIGCEEMDTMVTCLKGKNLSSIIAAGAKIPYLMQGADLSPVIDGSFLPDSPVNLLNAGKFDKVNVLIGVTNDDGSVMIPKLHKGKPFNISAGMSRQTFLEFVLGFPLTASDNQRSPSTKPAIIYRYTDWANMDDPARNRRMYIDLMSDAMFKAPAMFSASAFLKKKCPTYVYQLEYRSPYYLTGGMVPSWMRAYHASDVGFVFGLPLLDVNNTLSAEANFSRSVIQLWTNFAKNGNPNLPRNDYLSWPAYNSTHQQYIALKPVRPSVNTNLRADYMAFWNMFLPQTYLSKPTSTPAPATCKPVNSGVADYNGAWFSMLVSVLLVAYKLLVHTQ